MQTERRIGIDFGTSTSVIRIKRYQGDVAVGDKLETKSVTFNMGSTMVPSLLQKLKSGERVYFGHDAEVSHKDTVMISNFKMNIEDPIEEIRKEARDNTFEFFKYLAKNYKTQSENGYLGEKDDYEKTIVSYPVKWKDDTKEFMLETARKAGFPHVEGIDEAQAAIRAVTAQNVDLLSRKGYVKSGIPVNILLIDMGAGTTDLVLCKYTLGDNPQTEILNTWPKSENDLFGGREVDEILKNYIAQYIPEEYAPLILKKIGTDKYKAWKETIVAPALKKKECIDYFSALNDLLDMLDVEVEYTIDRESFEKFASDYLKKFPKLVNGCIDAAGLKGEDIDLVILTGGHSQWYFVSEILSGELDKFGSSNLRKICDDPRRILSIALPQETVALGLVYREIEKTLACTEEMDTTCINKDKFKQISNMIIPEFEHDIEWIEKEKIENTKEKLVYIEGTNATCIDKGVVRCWHKTSDNTFYEDKDGSRQIVDVVIPALGHDFEWIEEENQRIQQCKRCGKIAKVEDISSAQKMNKEITWGLNDYPEQKKEKIWDIDYLKKLSAASENEFEIVAHGNECGIKKYLGKDPVVVIPSEIRGHKVICIENRAFENQTIFGKGKNKLLEAVIIPESVQVIDSMAFFKCINLKVVVAHNKIREIGNATFCGCNNLQILDFGNEDIVKNVVKFPKEIKSIGWNAFMRFNYALGMVAKQCIFQEVWINKNTKLKSQIGWGKTFRKDICALFYY